MEEENKDEIKEQKPETPVGDGKKDEGAKDPEPAPDKDPLDEIKSAYEAKLEEEKKKAEVV